jgi:hypothetical protein
MLPTTYIILRLRLLKTQPSETTFTRKPREQFDLILELSGPYVATAKLEDLLPRAVLLL